MAPVNDILLYIIIVDASVCKYANVKVIATTDLTQCDNSVISE